MMIISKNIPILDIFYVDRIKCRERVRVTKPLSECLSLVSEFGLKVSELVSKLVSEVSKLVSKSTYE